VIPISDSLAGAIRAGAAGHTPGMSAQGWPFPNGTGGHLSVYQVGGLVRHVLPDPWTMHTLRIGLLHAPTAGPGTYGQFSSFSVTPRSRQPNAIRRSTRRRSAQR
jgi:hypothetical protein